MPIPLLATSGLVTAPNELSVAEGGALTAADNVVIRNKGVIEPRRGERIFKNLPDANDRIDQIFSFRGSLLYQYDSTLACGAPFLDVDEFAGSYTPPPAIPMCMKGTTAQDTFFFTSDVGVQSLDDTTREPIPAGIPRAYDVVGTTPDVGQPISATTSFPWMTTNTRVAYRCVWGRYDAHGREILGAPSGRTYYSNTTGGTRALNLGVLAVPGCTNDYFFRVYRTEMSPSSTVEPPEACYQVYEAKGADAITVAAGDIADSGAFYYDVDVPGGHNFTEGMFVRLTTTEAGLTHTFGEVTNPTATYFRFDPSNGSPTPAFVSTIEHTFEPHFFPVVDYCPQVLLGDPLYTNATDGEGDINSNFQPPYCYDVTFWNDRAWFANTKQKDVFQLRLLGVATASDTPDGLAVGDTITIAGRTYDGVASVTADMEFTVSSASTPSVNVEITARALVQAINNDPAALVRAYYVSSGDDFGSILLEAKEYSAVGAAQFSVYSSNTTAWAPYLTSSSSGAKTSTADECSNRLYYSRYQQPEAVPLLNFLDVGPKGSGATDILRIVPLRDKLFVFKEEGIYTVSGEAPYRVDLFDRTAVLIAPDTVAEVNNQLFCLTTQGVVAISDAGVQVVSRAIEPDLAYVHGASSSGPTTEAARAQTKSFGIGYESERLYILGLAGTFSYAHYVYVYNTMLGTWTRWYGNGWSCGLVHNNLLYTGSATTNSVFAERKAGTADDYVIGETAMTASAWNSSTGVLTVTTTTGLVNNPTTVVYQVATGAIGRITAFGATTVTLADVTGTFAAGAVLALNPMTCVVSWAAQTAASPETTKQFREATFHFRAAQFLSGTASFATDVSQSGQQVDVEFATGTLNNSGASTSARHLPTNKRVPVPKEKQRAAYLMPTFSVTEARAFWALNGVTLQADPGGSERGNK